MKYLIEKMYQRMEQNFTRWDYGFLKLYGGLFGLMMGAYFPEFVKRYLVIFAAVFLVLMVRYIYVLFFKNGETAKVEH